ncbi:serine-rich protein-like protein [Perilla frutescens var. frutescens]|nr:serine-rich protein-like protein [Perilla frutescens var. frutescens]
MATSSRRSSGPVLSGASAFQRAGGLRNSSMMTSDSKPSFASSTSYYSSSSAGFFNQRRSTSPTRVNLHGLSPTPSVRFAIDRSISPRRSIAGAPRSQVVQRSGGGGGSIQKRTCMCSPTSHPGSFRCALHKNSGGNQSSMSMPYSPNRLNMRRSAMTNSLVRIGTVEGDLVKRALAALIRPSSHQQRRRAGFQARPSRLSVMSKAED